MTTPRKPIDPKNRRKQGGPSFTLPRIRPKAQHFWVFGSAAFFGFAALNATVLQPGAHPAPLFKSDQVLRPSAMSVRPGPLADPNVRELQSRLQAMGLYDGDLDGLMGRRTLNAVYAALEGEAAEPVAQTLRADRPSAGAGAGDPLAALLQSSKPRRISSGSSSRSEPEIAKDAIVRLVQERLAERGFDPGPVDGMMGRATREALGAFQASEGLPVSNGTDTETLAALGLSSNG